MDEMRRVNRRAFLKISVMGAGSAAAAALLAACGGAVATDTPKAGATIAPTTGAAPTSAPTTAPAASNAPATTGMMAANGKTIPELKVAVAGLPESMDPQKTVSNVGMRVHYFMYDTLIRRDFLDNNKLVPHLATDWKRVDDRTLEMNLRRDVLWQDGTPFTADDVVYTFKRIIGKDPMLEVASPGYFPLDSVEKTGDYAVRFVSTAVDPVLEKRFAGLGAGIIPAKYHQMLGPDQFAQKPIGTGPYKLVELANGDHLTFEAHDKYFMGAPVAKRVTIRLIPEVASRIAAAINGEVDIATNVPPDQLATLKSKSTLTTKIVPLANMHVIKYNMKAKPTDNKFVRQALSMAIDRKTLTETIWGGNALHTRGFQFDGEELFNANRPLSPYDPDKAKALLKQGNYANEQIFYLSTSPNYYTNEREAGEAIVEMWKAAGINAKLELAESASKDPQFNNGSKQVSTWSATSGTGDPDGYLWRNWGPDNALQKGGYWTAESAAKYNDLGKQARSTLDTQKRFDLYQQQLDEYESEAPGTTLYIPKEIYTIKNTLDWTPYPLYYMDLRAYNFKIK